MCLFAAWAFVFQITELKGLGGLFWKLELVSGPHFGPLVLICQFYPFSFKSLTIQRHVTNFVKFLSIPSKMPLYISETCLLRH